MRTRCLGIRSLAIGMLLLRTASATTLIVPPPEEIIRAADIIVVGRFAAASNPVFEIEKIMKSPVAVSGGLRVYSPYPENAFALDQMLARLNGEQTILIGRWDPERKAINLWYGNSSFWPQGIPAGKRPTGSLDELCSFILAQISSETGAGAPPRGHEESMVKAHPPTGQITATPAKPASVSPADASATGQSLRASDSAPVSPRRSVDPTTAPFRLWPWGISALVVAALVFFGVKRR